MFLHRLRPAAARRRRHDEMADIMVLNIDRFKQVNECLGFDAGDVLPRKVAGRLKGALRGVDAIARPGGDE